MTEQEWLTCEDPQRMIYYLCGGSEGLEGNVELWRASGRKLRLIACGCVRQVWHLLTDERSRRSVEVAERVADGEATGKDRGVEFNFTYNIRDHIQRVLVQACLRSNIASSLHDTLTAYADINNVRPNQVDAICDIISNPFRPVTVDPQWLTPTVVSLVQAAYDERETVLEQCPHCRKPGRYCGECHGTTKRQVCTGRLDPVTLLAVADALEEAGCSDEVEYVEAPAVMCCPKCGETGDHVRGNQAAYLMRCNSTECRFEWVLGETYRVKVVIGPNPILAHLRSSGPHWRGCWAVDALTGRS